MRNCILAILLILAPSFLLAATIHIPSDQPTIQAGINTATEGDTVELADGTYQWDGNRDLDFSGKNLVIRSASGNPESCIIDADGSMYDYHRAFNFHSGEGPESRLENLGITGGWVESDYYTGGGGIQCLDGSSPTIHGCYFFGNYGSAIYCKSWSNAQVSDCRFVGNHGRNGGGAQLLTYFGTFSNCDFINNTAEYAGGGLRGQGVQLLLQDCRFIGNMAPCGAAVDIIYGDRVTLEKCHLEYNLGTESFWSCIINFHGMVTGELVNSTFVNNTIFGSGGYGIVTSKMSHGIIRGCTFYGNFITGGTLIKFGESDGLVENTIIANNPAGRPLYIGTVVGLSCTNIWGNPEGDWTQHIEGYLGVGGNISEDPQFCDPSMGDFNLMASSPCAPENNNCGLMGAWPVGCSTSSETTTWSELKALF